MKSLHHVWKRNLKFTNYTYKLYDIIDLELLETWQTKYVIDFLTKLPRNIINQQYSQNSFVISMKSMWVYFDQCRNWIFIKVSTCFDLNLLNPVPSEFQTFIKNPIDRCTKWCNAWKPSHENIHIFTRYLINC